MAKLNMANMNTLFKKGYLFAGVVMAANIFIVNEIKAMKENGKENMGGEIKIKTKESDEPSILDRVLSWENTFNLFGGLAFSCVNNYFKWWDYNPGGYFKLRCLGLRSKRFLNDMFQFEINLNLGRGAIWTILGLYNVINFKEEVYAAPLYVSFLVASRFRGSDFMRRTAFIGVFLIQGFISIPLTLHLFNFSISLSLDSIIWAGIGFFLDKNDNGEEGGEEGKIYDRIDLKENNSQNYGSIKEENNEEDNNKANNI